MEEEWFILWFREESVRQLAGPCTASRQIRSDKSLCPPPPPGRNFPHRLCIRVLNTQIPQALCLSQEPVENSPICASCVTKGGTRELHTYTCPCGENAASGLCGGYAHYSSRRGKRENRQRDTPGLGALSPPTLFPLLCPKSTPPPPCRLSECPIPPPTWILFPPFLLCCVPFLVLLSPLQVL